MDGSQHSDRLLSHVCLDYLQCTAASTRPAHLNGKSSLSPESSLQAQLSNSERAAGDAAAEAGATAAKLQRELEEQKQEFSQLHKQLKVDDQQVHLLPACLGIFPGFAILQQGFQRIQVPVISSAFPCLHR